jgi:hypothetical protein
MNDRVGIETFEEGPFGIADGHLAAIDHDNFVEVDPLISQLGTAARSGGHRGVRVLVGRKGSGKTVYLRRFQASAEDEDSVVATAIEQRTPPTEHIIEFSHWHRGHNLTERWSQVWRVAILRAVCTHALFSKHLSDYGNDECREALSDLAVTLLPEVGAPRGPYNQLSEIIAAHGSPQELDRALREPAWGDLEYWLGEFIRDAPPLFFYLDAVDEEYKASPNYWMRCQQGLFYQVMRLLRDPMYGSRLHIVISVRDNVFSSVLRSEHATRYRTDPHIKVLTWNRTAIDYFLHRKLELLDPRFLMTDSGERRIVDWLGRDTVYNDARALEEPLGDYLVRHTRLLPRDIILLGNALTDAVMKAKKASKTAVDEAEIREVVSRVATWCGWEQLEVCGNQILGDLVPHGAARKSELKPYTSGQEYERHISGRIAEIVTGLGEDQFDHETLEVLAEMGREEIDDSIDLPSVLWQNGLLGFGDPRIGPDDWIFHGVEDVDSFLVPTNRDRYAFHPCLLDTLGLSGGGPGTKPVRPWRRGV